MSYCCSTCRKLDENLALPALAALIAHYNWSGFAKLLKGLAEDPEVMESYEQFLDAQAAEAIRIAGIRAAEEERRRLKRQKNATRRIFRPPYADNLVSAEPIPQEPLFK